MWDELHAVENERWERVTWILCQEIWVRLKKPIFSAHLSAQLEIKSIVGKEMVLKKINETWLFCCCCSLMLAATQASFSGSNAMLIVGKILF